MFGRKKTESPIVPDVSPQIADGKKGRPTPKRREQEAARKKPLVQTDRKAAAAANKEARRAEAAKRRDGIARGDEKSLPERDRGPIKRFIRNTVDSRWNIGEILLPVMLVILATMLINNSSLQAFSLLAVWLLVVVGVLDAVLLWRRTKRAIIIKFGQAPPRGSVYYTVMRSFQMRLSRMPKPQVSRGDKSWR